jgi:multidrug resistance efflux pump
MRPLKKRLRVDSIPNEQRVIRGRAGRMLYLLFLGMFAIAIANYMLGDYVLFEADGLVLRDQNVIATTYVARVDSVEVKEGQTVSIGTPLLKLQSSEILEHLADLSTKRADLLSKVVDFKVRAENVVKLLPLAEQRVSEATSTIKEYDSLALAKLVTSTGYQEALRVSYEANRDRINLSTQAKVLSEELAALKKAQAGADDAILKLQQLYADGKVVAPENGSIGASIPSVGNVYRPGDPILSVYTGDPYVLVFLPRRYLFPISIGMDVKISDGRDTADGVITEILLVTDTLPKEFQNTFKPSDRNQLAKIKLQSTSRFPLNQKVSVSRTTVIGELTKIRDALGLDQLWG